MTESTRATHGCTVLVVDDDEDLREVVTMALELDGYTVKTASNGREALERLRSTPDVCLIVLDLMLPMVNGDTFRSAQLRDRSLAWIPIVVLSGATDAAAHARALHAHAVVRKPVDVDLLRETLRRVGCRRSARRLSDDDRHDAAELAARQTRR